MREIKFRAWDSKNGEMVYSDKEDCFYINKRGALFMYAEPNPKQGTKTKYHYEYDLMQYTGLKDKNGTEIYEGDVLKVTAPEETDAKDIQIVKFEEGFWSIELLSSHHDYDKTSIHCAVYYDDHEVEVIGNIHEHKHLLEG